MKCLQQLAVYALILILLNGCATVPETGRSQLQLLPEAQLTQMSLTAFNQMKQEIPLSQNRVHVEQVNRIGRRIAAVLDDDFAESDWEFVVFEDPTPNAFAMPGGKVGVHTGLIKMVDSDDELAVVIGHEIAHVTLRHGNERMSQQLLAAGAAALMSIGIRDMNDRERGLVMAAFGAGSTVGILLPFSRLHETEADTVGLIYSTRAGYDPRTALTFWRKMAALKSGPSAPSYLSTHPSDSQRIENIEAMMPELIKVYEANRHKN